MASGHCAVCKWERYYKMPNYGRAWHPGGTYFFTVNLLQRHGNDRLTRHIEMFREIVAWVQSCHPFRIHG